MVVTYVYAILNNHRLSFAVKCAAPLTCGAAMYFHVHLKQPLSFISSCFRTCMYSAENACLVIALGAALAFPPGFLLSALGVRTWCSIHGEAAAPTQRIRAASRGSVWALPHFHCTLNTVKICVKNQTCFLIFFRDRLATLLGPFFFWNNRSA